MSTIRRIACIRLPSPPTGAARPGPDARATLAGALLRAAPRVTPVRGHPRALWADAGGMERRGGDEAVGRAVRQAALEAGFPDAKVGIAASCIAAAAATRERGMALRVVPPGADRRYLRPRSLSILPLPDDLRQTLGLLGVRTCGQLAALTPADVELRFGPAGVAAWRLARGEDARWPFRPADPGVAAAEAGFEPPIRAAEPLRFVLPGLIASVCGQLEGRQRIPGWLRLVLSVETADGPADDVREVRPARPTADARVLADLCRRVVEERPLAGPLSGVRLEAPEAAAPRADQLDAFTAPAPDPGAVHAALLPVFARWGDGALSGAVRHGAHLPAEHAAWDARGSAGIAPFAGVRPPAEDAPAAGPDLGSGVLDLCLRRLPAPRPLRVREGDGRRPLGVDFQVAQRDELGPDADTFPPAMWKTFAEGPERVSGAWWEAGSAREYWRVASPDGWLGLVYRDAASGGWYLEGWYD